MPPRPAPPAFLATAVATLLTVLWGYLRLGVFSDALLPLTYVLPLLICVWTRRSWHVWAMAGTFILFTLLKAGQLHLDGTPLAPDEYVFLATTLVNVVIGAIVVRFLVAYRARLEAQHRQIFTQNAELEAQAEELTQQNEEIRVQSEELAQQNEEIHAQSEELTRQNEELQQGNTRLGVRERMLQDLLESSRNPDAAALAMLCRNALTVLGEPADRVALLEPDGNAGLRLVAHATRDGGGDLPKAWPLDRSLTGLVMRSDRTAYLSDVAGHPLLAAPFTAEGPVRSILATPLRAEGVPSGILVACSTQACHWTDEQFQLIEWIGAMGSHVTGGIQARAALAARSQELEAANRAKDEFLAMLSHELRTPLTPVLAASGALAADETLPAATREDLAMIRRNVTIQSRLIDDLLDLTRIERRRLDLAHEPCVPAALLRDAAAIVAPDIDAREQILVVQSDVPDHWRITGDPSRLQQVIWNLLQNATKFSPPRSTIHCTARLLPGNAARVELAVEDQGPGVPAAEMERIFRPFEQIRNVRRIGRETGLGLGLAIARAIVELHAGSLAVGPGAGGRGARFTVELPLVPAHAVSDVPANGEATSEACPEPLSILLVEDHSDTGRVIAQLLKGAGHDVVHAKTATEAFDCFQRGRFNFIISDIGLPDESGLALMRRLRSVRPSLTGLCMTGYGMESDQQACFAAGFSEHLAKPVDVQRLLAAINRTARQPERLSGV